MSGNRRLWYDLPEYWTISTSIRGPNNLAFLDLRVGNYKNSKTFSLHHDDWQEKFALALKFMEENGYETEPFRVPSWKSILERCSVREEKEVRYYLVDDAEKWTP